MRRRNNVGCPCCANHEGPCLACLSIRACGRGAPGARVRIWRNTDNPATDTPIVTGTTDSNGKLCPIDLGAYSPFYFITKVDQFEATYYDAITYNGAICNFPVTLTLPAKPAPQLPPFGCCIPGCWPQTLVRTLSIEVDDPTTPDTSIWPSAAAWAPCNFVPGGMTLADPVECLWYTGGVGDGGGDYVSWTITFTEAGPRLNKTMLFRCGSADAYGCFCYAGGSLVNGIPGPVLGVTWSKMATSWTCDPFSATWDLDALTIPRKRGMVFGPLWTDFTPFINENCFDGYSNPFACPDLTIPSHTVTATEV